MKPWRFIFISLFVPLSLSANNMSLPYEKWTLANGLEVILQHDPRIPFVAFSLWVHTGATVERPPKTGFAHLFEHLMFEGSKHVKDSYFAILQEAGASSVNGTTGFDRTNYFGVVPKSELELSLWLESDRLGWLLDALTQEKLNEQRGVVKNERLQRYDNQPYGKASEKAWQKLFPASHPYYGMVIGSMDDLDQASLIDVENFFATHYSPANLTLTLVGDFDRATVRPLVEKYFGSLRGKTKPPRAHVAAPNLKSEIRLVETEPLGKLTRVQIQYLTPALYAPGDADCDVLSHLLANDKSSRLYKTLMLDQQLVQSINASQSSYGDLSIFSFDALLQEGVAPEAVLAVLDSEIERIAKESVTEEEIVRAVRAVQTNQLFALQKIGGASGRSEQLQAYNHYRGEPDSLAVDLSRYDQVTPRTIQDTLKKYLIPKHRVVLFAIPKSLSKSVEAKS